MTRQEYKNKLIRFSAHVIRLIDSFDAGLGMEFVGEELFLRVSGAAEAGRLGAECKTVMEHNIRLDEMRTLISQTLNLLEIAVETGSLNAELAKPLVLEGSLLIALAENTLRKTKEGQEELIKQVIVY